MLSVKLQCASLFFGVIFVCNGFREGSPVWTSRRHRYHGSTRPIHVRGGSSTDTTESSYVLVTGGAGYIGSHTCLELLNAGQKAVIVDNLVNSDVESLKRVRELTGCRDEDLIFREVDITDVESLDAVFEEFNFDSCIHFAGLKAVGESVALPLKYYDNNIGGTVALLSLLDKHDVRRLVFSSSATVYGDPESLPIDESAALTATNPYGRTKLFIEEILRDVAKTNSDWKIMILRYFNPIGAHESGRIGEDPEGIPNNLMPYISQVSVGRLEQLSVFGSDYDTPDGTGVRDYVHVVDLAVGHVKSIAKLREMSEGCCEAVNLGTGQGLSVLDLVKGMEEATGKPIPYKLAPRRPGDVASCYCDPSHARRILGWAAERGLSEMCRDTSNWQSANPNGYRPSQ